jgi:hypothetical protein
LRATRAMAPEILLAAIWRCTVSLIRCSRSGEKPTFSGFAVGSPVFALVSAAWDGGQPSEGKQCQGEDTERGSAERERTHGQAPQSESGC